jgi:hypothetical protein
MTQYELSCKVCDKPFAKLGSLHKHIKQHDMHLAEYYVKFYARKNLLTGDLLPFKDVESYFNKDFTNRIQMNKWLEQLDPLDAQEYIQSKILKRVYDKKRNFLPFHLELEHCFLPKLDIIKKIFGSYSHFAELCDLDLMFDKNIPSGFFDEDLPKNIEIAIDTREQKPLDFQFNTKKHKLSFGDYTLLGDHYSYTFVDRKSSNDFCGTLTTVNLDRFRREIQLTQDMDAYMFVVVESSLDKIIAEQKYFKRKASIDYILKNMRDIMYDFPRRCQFIFTGGRKNSKFLIPRILYYGKDLWGSDLQYFIDHELAKRKSKQTAVKDKD